MAHDPRAYLWDMQAAGEAIVEFTSGKTLNDYLGDRTVWATVEEPLPSRLAVVTELLDGAGAP